MIHGARADAGTMSVNAMPTRPTAMSKTPLVTSLVAERRWNRYPDRKAVVEYAAIPDPVTFPMNSGPNPSRRRYRFTAMR